MRENKAGIYKGKCNRKGSAILVTLSLVLLVLVLISSIIN